MPRATAAANAAMQSWAVVSGRNGSGSSKGSHSPYSVITLRLRDSVTRSGVCEVMEIVLRPLMPQVSTAVPFKASASKPASASTAAANTSKPCGGTAPSPSISTECGACRYRSVSAYITSLQRNIPAEKYAAAPLSPVIITDKKTPPKR